MSLRSTRFDVRRYGAGAKLHSHDHHQLVLPLAGVLEMDIDGSRDDVTEARAAAIPAGRPHSFAGSRDNAFLVVDMPAIPDLGDAGRARFWQRAGDNPFIGVDPLFRGFCDFVAGQLPRLGYGGLTAGGLRAEVAGDLVIEALSESLGLDSAPLSAPLSRALDLIETRYAEPLTVAAMAHHAGLSESRLHALFKARFGLSPGRYLAHQRLRRAEALLSGTALPISEVALAVGYGDQSAFARAFQRDTGEAPAEFRRRQQERHEIR